MNKEPLFFKTLLLKGEPGGTIERIVKTETVGLTDIYTIYINDGSTQEIEVTNGSSIASIEYTSSSGNVDTYTVTLTDGSTTTFNVTNGEDYTVPTDGVIYYDGADIPDGYEETSAPSGSGVYATIDDSNASVSTTYSSSKIEQLISGIGGGGVDYSTTEQDTGLKWIDGKPIYQKTITKNNTVYGNATQINANVADMDKLIDHKCTLFFADAEMSPPITDNGQAIMVMHLGGGLIMLGRNGISIPADSTRTWHLTLYYTKTTD